MNNKKILFAYAAYSKNDIIRLRSSSGAVFSLLAESILSKNGIVYGVAMSEDCKSAEFIRAEDETLLPKIFTSKYIQAKVGRIYYKVKEDLDNGKNVLFTGTGCQINGLKCFLGKNYDNLYCVDVICHGVPSPALWRKYVEHVETKNKSRLVAVNFRCKYNGWSDFGIEKTSENTKKVYISKDDDPYMQMFLKNYCLRPSCYECMAKILKWSDITIGDFWGIEKVESEMNDNKGVSLVLIHSVKGKKLFHSIQMNVISKKVKYENAVKYNSAEYCSVKKPVQRDDFFLDMNSMNFIKLKRKYLPRSFGKRMKKILFKLFLLGGINNNYRILYVLEKDDLNL